MKPQENLVKWLKPQFRDSSEYWARFCDLLTEMICESHLHSFSSTAMGQKRRALEGRTQQSCLSVHLLWVGLLYIFRHFMWTAVSGMLAWSDAPSRSHLGLCSLLERHKCNLTLMLEERLALSVVSFQVFPLNIYFRLCLL